jgi:hypothetical protein
MNYKNYKNELKYPTEKDYAKYEIITPNHTYSNLHHDECQQLSKELQRDGIEHLRVLKSIDKDAYKLAQKKYNNEEQRIDELFRQDLQEYYGDFSDYVNADKLFSVIYYKAYEDGHSSGRQSVAEAYGDLYDFVRQILKLTEKNA